MERAGMAGIRKKLELTTLGIFLAAAIWAQAPSGPSPANLLFAKAFEFYQRGEYPASAAAFSALAQDGEDALAREAAYMEILARVNARDLDRAQEKAQAYLALGAAESRSAEIGYQLGRIAYLKADYPLAASRFEEIAALPAGGAAREAALYWRAECLYRLGKPQEAIQTLEGLAANPREGYARNLALLRLEIMGLEARKASEARKSGYAGILAEREAGNSEGAELIEEQRAEREFALTQALRSAYGLSSTRATRFYAEGKDPPPIPPGPSQAELELARANKLRQLLAAKNSSLELLASALSRFAEEVSK